MPGKLLMEVSACRVLPQARVPGPCLSSSGDGASERGPALGPPPPTPELVPNVTAEQSANRVFGVRRETFAAGWSQEGGQTAGQPPAAASAHAFLILVHVEK